MALIEIDGLPINSMVIFHGYVKENQMVLGRFFGRATCFFLSLLTVTIRLFLPSNLFPSAMEVFEPVEMVSYLVMYL